MHRDTKEWLYYSGDEMEQVNGHWQAVNAKTALMHHAMAQRASSYRIAGHVGGWLLDEITVPAHCLAIHYYPLAHFLLVLCRLSASRPRIRR